MTFIVVFIRILGKTKVPRDVRNSKVRKQDKFSRDWSRHSNTCKSQSGTGLGARSKRPLLACSARCKRSLLGFARARSSYECFILRAVRLSIKFLG